MSVLNKKLLYSVDTKEYPGKVRVRYVTFIEELIPKEQFSGEEFLLCDMDDPIVRQFLKVGKQ